MTWALLDPRAETSGGVVAKLSESFSVFRLRNYRLFWIGGLVSNIGRWFQTIAIPIVVFDLTDSATWVGLSGFALIMPMGIVGPLGGSLADRYPRRNVLIVTQILQAAAALVLTTMWFAGVRSAGAYVAVSVLVGLTAGLNVPAWQAFVSELVPREQLMAGITLTSAQFNASRMVGPALGGLLVAWAGPGWAFAVNAVSFAGVLIALSLIRLDYDWTPPEDRMRPFREFVVAARYAFADEGIRPALLAVAILAFFGMSLQALIVTIAEDVFDRGEQGFGLLLSAVGLGAVMTAPFIAPISSWLTRSQIQQVGLLAYAGSALLIAATPWFSLALLGAFLMGSAHMTSTSTLNTAVQLQVKESDRAKVLAVYLAVFTVSNPVGQLLLGQLIDRTEPRIAYAGVSVAFVLIAFALSVSGILRGLDWELDPQTTQV